MKRKLRVLGPWQEFVDVLVDVDDVRGVLVFRRHSVAVPFEMFTRHPQLTSLIGIKIRLLRTDLPDRKFIVTVAERVHVPPQQTDVCHEPGDEPRYV